MFSRHRSPRSGHRAEFTAGTAVLLLILAACGGSTGTGSSSTSSSPSPAAAAPSSGATDTSPAASGSAGATAGTSGGPVKVGLVLALTANPFMQEVAMGSNDAASDLGASVIVTGPPAPNPTVGVNDLNQVVAQGVAGVTIMPLPASLWSKGVSEAAAKTKVNTINNLPVRGIPGSETYIGINDAEASKVLVDYLLAKLGSNPTGNVVLGTCIPGASSLDTRTQTYISYLKAKAPGVTIIGPITTTTDPSKNLSTWQQAYAAHPNALAYIGNCDNDGPSLGRMHEQHPGKYLTGTFDIDAASLTAVKSGSLTVAVDESPYVRGYLATAALIMQAQGKAPVTGFVNIKGVLVTPDNVESAMTRQATPASIRAGFAAPMKAFLADPKTATGPFVLEPIANAYVGVAD